LTDLRYYSGAQTSLFIGNIWVDDIDQISFTTKSSKAPIYGYGSTHFDFVTKGSTLVQGNFSINFREPNYLWAVLKNYEKFNGELKFVDKKDRDNLIKDVEAKNISIVDYPFSFENDPRSNYDFFFNQPASKAQSAAQALRDKQRKILDTQNRQSSEKFHHNSFNILLGYGDRLDSDSPGELISGVHLLERTKTIVVDGRPIKEVYSFIARKID